MTHEILHPRRHVNWRTAIMLEGRAQPLYGHTLEAAESIIVIQLANLLPVGLECRVYLDIPDPDTRQPTYVDFRIKVLETSLMGQVSQFRHTCQITRIKPEQLVFLKRILAH